MGQTVETNSLEVRWFGDGDPPAALDAWIADLGTVDTATRTDLYVVPPSPSFNLKLRSQDGESVELKRRLDGPERTAFGPDVTGDVEQWYKWSFPLEGPPRPWRTDPTGLWLPVEKTRTLSAFDDAALDSIDPDLVDGDVTAHVEVTAVTARSAAAWTCGLEVAGAPDDLERAFDAVAAAVFDEEFPVSLSAAQSSGYVGWLADLAADARPADAVLVPSKRAE
jgi:hypothetical protein